MTWNDLYHYLHQRILEDKDFAHDSVTIYAAGSGEYYPLDSIHQLTPDENDGVLDPGATVLIIQD